jgi:hypothetical protein
VSSNENAQVAAARKDKYDERRFQMRMGLTGGLFGLIAALFGSAAGAGGAYWVANRQVNAEAEQSAAEFLRTERRDAYGDFLGEHQRVLAVEQGAKFILDYEGSTVKQYRQAVDDIVHESGAIQAQAAAVGLVGSESISSSAQQIADDHQRLIASLYACLVSRNFDGLEQRVRSACRELEANYSAVADVANTFVADARAELEDSGL